MIFKNISSLISRLPISSKEKTLIHYRFLHNVSRESCVLLHRRPFGEPSTTATSSSSSPRKMSTSNLTLWMSECRPVLFCQSCMESFHATLDVPWWAAIALTTAILRVGITFPVTVYQNIVIARLENLQPEIKEIAEELKRETALAATMYKWPENHSRFMFNRSLKKQITNLIIRDNCHPFKSSLVIWIQMPIWFWISFALRNMVYMLPSPNPAAQILYTELAVGGALWFPNLTLPDHSLILPVLLGLINWAIVEVHAIRKVNLTRFQTIVTNLMRVTSFVMIPIAASVPTCMSFYWTLSSLIGLSQNIILQIPQMRRFCRIPQTPSESKQPFQDAIDNFKSKLKL